VRLAHRRRAPHCDWREVVDERARRESVQDLSGSGGVGARDGVEIDGGRGHIAVTNAEMIAGDVDRATGGMDIGMVVGTAGIAQREVEVMAGVAPTRVSEEHIDWTCRIAVIRGRDNGGPYRERLARRDGRGHIDVDGGAPGVAHEGTTACPQKRSHT